MSGKARGWWMLWLVWCLFAPAGWGQAPAVIREIEIQHVGPRAASDALIRSSIRSRVGELYTRNSVDDDVRSLYGTGLFFNIRVDQVPVEGGLKLVFQVQGKPTLTRILFTGNSKYSTKKLQKKVTSKVGQPLDEQKLFNDTQEILKLYQKAGYQRTQVKYVPVIDANLGNGTVTFEITEAPKVKIKDVQFVNAEAFPQRKLRSTLKTRRHWMFSWLTGSGKLKDDVLAEDRQRLAEFYRGEGYIDFQLEDIQFEQLNPKWMILKVFVSEGTQYRVGTVGLEGNQLFTTNEITTRMVTRERNKASRGLSMGPGSVFTPNGLSRDREGIADFYGARGHIDARVSPGLVPNTAQGTMDVNYRISEGQKSYIEKIEIRGNTKTKDRVIRRELAVNPGEVFDMVRVRLSTNRLGGLNYFAKVDAEPEPTDVPDRKNLVIGVEEKNTGDIRLGAGFSSLDQITGFVEVVQGNFDLFKPPYFLGTGAGQKIRLRLQVGTRRRDIELSFIEPWFLGRKLVLSTDFFYRQLRYYSDLYDVDQLGSRVTLTRTLWSDFWRGTVGYAIENVGIVDMPSPVVVPGPDGQPEVIDTVPAEIRAEEGYTLASKVIGAISYDTRNNVLLPNRGQHTTLRSELAGGPFGGDTDFYKLELDSRRYFRGFAAGHVLELIGRIGVVDNHGFDEDVHLYDRFYLGGLYTLRGYAFRGIGPYDSTGREPIGGRTFWFGSAEYSIPIIERLRLAAFYDIGNVYPDAYSFTLAGPDYGAYADNWGVGIRLNIPGMGPLRLDYAIPITHDPFVGSDGRFQFSVGYTRDTPY
ncbi:MAG: outer membrane protein assembly factor BamA [Verrucomicrobiales bacterium]|nr:outer membrane protein assembly factor BamA [Verrucomicrobiales bacterium]